MRTHVKTENLLSAGGLRIIRAKRIAGTAWCLILLLMAGPAVQAANTPPAPPASLEEAIGGGKLLLNLRPRYEQVEQASKPETAVAGTMRTLFGWKTAPFRGLGATLEFIDVNHLTNDDKFNFSPTASATYPTIADPENTDINQAFIEFTGLADTSLRVGRQSIKLDNVRFVGNVEFRQVMQVMDGVSVTNKSIPGVTAFYGHFNYLKTIFAVKNATQIDLINIGWDFAPEQKLVGFAYFQDQPGAIAASGFAGTAPTDTSNRIVGLRLDGAAPMGEGPKLLYSAEYAAQKNHGDGDARIDATYWHAGGGLKWKPVYVRVDYEVLGSNDGLYGFQTPLGTNHLFQGWADLFLTTPANGIRDRFVTLGGTLGRVTWIARAHDFKSDFGGISYGKEVDLSLSYPLRTNLVGRFEYANFKEDVLLAGAARKPDTEKIWVTLIYNFQ